MDNVTFDDAVMGEEIFGPIMPIIAFDAFSHYKSIVDKKTWLDLPMRYAPYRSRLYEALLRLFLK